MGRKPGIPWAGASWIEQAYRLTRRTWFWEGVFGTPDRVADWHVISYEYIDDLDFMPWAREVLRKWEFGELLIAAVAERCLEAGWEGDGEFQVLWLPPFLGIGKPDYGCYALVVKQNNDGTAWIACPIPLPVRDSSLPEVHPIYAEFERRALEEGRAPYPDIGYPELDDDKTI